MATSLMADDDSVMLAATILMEMANADQSKKNTKRKRPLKNPTLKNKREKLSETAVPEIPVAMREKIEEMGGNRLTLVIQKPLTHTDLSKEHGRFLMPPKKLKTHDFLTGEENTAVRRRVGKTVVGMNVPVIGACGGERKLLQLKKWKVGSEEAYCFVKNWNSFAEENELGAGDILQVWSFRKNGDGSGLHFCLVKVGKEEKLINGGAGSKAEGESCLTD